MLTLSDCRQRSRLPFFVLALAVISITWSSHAEYSVYVGPRALGVTPRVAVGGNNACFWKLCDDTDTIHLREGAKDSDITTGFSFSEFGFSPDGHQWWAIRLNPGIVSGIPREYGSRTFVVGDPTGKVILEIDDIFAADWNGKNGELAIIRGSSNENAFGFSSKGVFVLDNSLENERKIFCEGYAVAWAAFDGRLYIYHPTKTDHNVYAYEPVSGKVTCTPYEGIHFSPDGKYYYTTAGEGSSLEFVVERESNRHVLTTERADDKNRYRFVRWLNPRFVLVEAQLAGKFWHECWDAETGLISNAPGPGAFSYDGEKLEYLVINGGKVTTQNVTK